MDSKDCWTSSKWDSLDITVLKMKHDVFKHSLLRSRLARVCHGIGGILMWSEYADQRGTYVNMFYYTTAFIKTFAIGLDM